MTALAWICFAAIPVSIWLTSLSYRFDRRRDARDWQTDLDAADERARDAEQLATKTAQEAARLRQRLLLQAPRVFPSAPRSGQRRRVVREGPSPVYDALVLEQLHATPIKRARKPRAVRNV